MLHVVHFFQLTRCVAQRYGSNIIVRQGSPGIIVGNCEDGCHLTVKFDEREDGSELCVNVPRQFCDSRECLITLPLGQKQSETEVVPEALMLPLPGGFRLHQKVVALYELLLNSDMKVPLGSLLKTWPMHVWFFHVFPPWFCFFPKALLLGISSPSNRFAVSKAQLVTSLEALGETE